MVTSVRTAEQYGGVAFQIVTPDRTYFLKASTRTEMQVSGIGFTACPPSVRSIGSFMKSRDGCCDCVHEMVES